MKACRFPAIGEHNGEHLRVLGELMRFARNVEAGHLGLARVYVKALPKWFNSHLATMDSALAACLKARLPESSLSWSAGGFTQLDSKRSSQPLDKYSAEEC